MASIATLKRISAKSLSEKLIAGLDESNPSVAVVDVRDDDYIGGHIKGCIHIPSQQLDAMMPTLIRRLQDKKTVVFHCALSQQRGPSAALRYLREGNPPEGQEVVVLDRGFSGWQEEFGRDERITEGYRKELWEEY
ncbi:Cdc25 phosphatase Ibp1 [Lecanicillium sp. MT-2017a]|nr:Cdc25 phosphatase Ibp1 [Lecanicillium sp. MT-2017a]